METIMFGVSIANLVLTILLSAAAIFVSFWFSSYRKQLPWEIARKHYKDVFLKGYCPACGSKDVECEAQVDSEDDGNGGIMNTYAGFDKRKCKKCHFEWDIGPIGNEK